LLKRTEEMKKLAETGQSKIQKEFSGSRIAEEIGKVYVKNSRKDSRYESIGSELKISAQKKYGPIFILVNHQHWYFGIANHFLSNTSHKKPAYAGSS
jgi:hypothetical protein